MRLKPFIKTTLQGLNHNKLCGYKHFFHPLPFGAFYAFTASRVRGTGLIACGVALPLANPLIWMTKGVFGLPELKFRLGHLIDQTIRN